ncbi:MAG: acyltransferase [Lachnospiraceae bacterium]|jgi:acetyltransferase-like isoleucine patch superfamily enzyme|nr:acyltransferase [Lachnospiraceae bacterium]
MKLIKVAYYVAKLKQKVMRSPEEISKFYRCRGMKIGSNTIICGYMPIAEPALVEIKNNCVISSEVAFITHDHSINKVTEKGSNLFGKITIGNNCFIGQRSTILYGVTLADNIIVGSGSLVTKSFLENNIIIAGNPARVVGSWDAFRQKYENKAAFMSELDDILNGNIDKLVSKEKRIASII